jgi:hypothetical protein
MRGAHEGRGGMGSKEITRRGAGLFAVFAAAAPTNGITPSLSLLMIFVLE